jgi:hypothetical protein
MSMATRNVAKANLRRFPGTPGPFPEKDFAFFQIEALFSKTFQVGSLRWGSGNTRGCFLKNEQEWLTA